MKIILAGHDAIVELIASTAITRDAVEESVPEYIHSDDLYGQDSDELTEIAGRLCYKSWHKPNPATASNEDYVQNIIDKGHYSCIEHSSATFFIGNVSRSFTHELVRHRLASYSQVSQRYCDESDADFVIPEDISAAGLEDNFIRNCRSSLYTYIKYYDKLRSMGLDVKSARGAARSVLPNAVATSIIVTMNMSVWRHFLKVRCSKYAEKEMRIVARNIRDQLIGISPNNMSNWIYGNDWSEHNESDYYLE